MAQALPGTSTSTPPAQSRAGGLLRVVTNSQLDAQEQARLATVDAGNKPEPPPDLGSYIRNLWTIFRNHRNTGQDPLNQRLLRAQRMCDGEYDPGKLAQIERFGGSRVYARIVAQKCRGATAMLREVYLNSDKPWDIQAEKDPAVPADIQSQIMQLVSSEVQSQQAAGQPTLPEQAHARIMSLMHAAQQAARRNADTRAASVGDKIEDILSEGKFYEVLSEFLTDLPQMPFACLKGPVVRMVPALAWADGRATIQNKPKMFWERVSPFDIYWTPGVSDIADADVLERKRFSRADLNQLLGVPGYDEQAIRGVLNDYAHGLREWLDTPDAERAWNEGRENPSLNLSQLIEGLEFHGMVHGQVLLREGVDPALVPDPDRDYSVQSWVIGRYTIKTQFNPSPKQRHPYFITSFEKVPGTVSGHGLPDLLEDIQEVCNATARSLVNNLGISSGPQVVVNDDMLSETEDGDDMYPWKRWHVQASGMGDSSAPISFFQPQSNAQELLAVYQAFQNMADEASAIPRYLTGSGDRLGGAGRTSSGLAMLMGNAQKVLQTVASNVDIDVMKPLLSALYDLIMLTDQSGMLSGQEQIRVRGVNVAIQQETERQKQLQFLQITANPIDAPIVGELGRARVLRSVAAGLGLPDDVVPDDTTIQAKMQAAQQMQTAGAAMQASAGLQQPQPGSPGAPASQGAGRGSGKPAPSRGALASGSQPPQATPAQASDIAPPVNSFQQGTPG